MSRDLEQYLMIKLRGLLVGRGLNATEANAWMVENMFTPISPTKYQFDVEMARNMIDEMMDNNHTSRRR